MNDVQQRKNKRIFILLMGIAIGMFGFGFALVPLYRVFCQATGLNGKYYQTNEVQKAVTVDTSREITVMFVSNNNDLLPWEFRPNNPVVRLHPGEVVRVSYHAKNKTINPMTVQAIPSIVPGIAAKYLHKTECFCFQQQTFAAGESMDMPILFHIDPDIPKHIRHVTVAYTLFDIKMAKATSIQKVGRIH